MMDRRLRPVIPVPRTWVDYLLEAIAASSLLFALITAWRIWPQLPAVIPTHFGINGQPDAWGPKQAFSVFPALCAGFYLLFTLVSLFPRFYNYAWPITPENAQRQYQLGRRLITALKAEVLLGLAYLMTGMTQVALGHRSGLGTAPLVIFLGMPLVTLVAYFMTARPRS